MLRELTVKAGLLGLVASLASGCASEATHRRAAYAEMRASLAEQRQAALEQHAAQLQGVVLVQQMMIAQQAQAAQMQALASQAPVPTYPAILPPGPRPLLDVAGSPLSTVGYGAAGEIVAHVEGYMGRSLTGPERMALGQILRRPRTLEATDPWLRMQ